MAHPLQELIDDFIAKINRPLTRWERIQRNVEDGLLYAAFAFAMICMVVGFGFIVRSLVRLVF